MSLSLIFIGLCFLTHIGHSRFIASFFWAYSMQLVLDILILTFNENMNTLLYKVGKIPSLTYLFFRLGSCLLLMGGST